MKEDISSMRVPLIWDQATASASDNLLSGKPDPASRQCSVLDCICCPCVFALGCVGCIVGLTAVCLGSCVFTVMACCGCAPEVRLEHIERYVYGKELWQAFLDGEGCGPEDPAREYCNKFFDSPRFKVRVNGLFDKYDADKSGKLDRDEVVEMLASLSTSLMSALTGTGPEILQTSEDHEKIKQAYQKMFQDKQLQLDRSTFTALSKLIVAQLILSASINLPNDFRHAQEEPTASFVVIEELSDDEPSKSS
mmetsp:Transcript_12747/g.24191  ORF Transcript_12747/g.24191 Transcript_12747/m.24191 type:complete len:251 (+) Transcript_12747:106-858(+)|eukprot:CAMPEP_0114267456 /NCGR_PEP_ID=MMETSP0058-20121206/25309_1 /TAXON_ID=36894 /ORGANISM="Pyramimonas parkeae, CCMP726" /LENGTH=250 /DNA_ID=CAMNT_0001385317 /DNA_START=52 /DNA_END=807 /DNA_ORIENTATION=+